MTYRTVITDDYTLLLAAAMAGVLERVPNGTAAQAPPDANLAFGYSGGPVGLLWIDRTRVGDDPRAVLVAWLQHVALLGVLVLRGWTPAERDGLPPLSTWKGPDGRVWVPLVYEGTFQSWQVVGGSADA